MQEKESELKKSYSTRETKLSRRSKLTLKPTPELKPSKVMRSRSIPQITDQQVLGLLGVAALQTVGRLEVKVKVGKLMTTYLVPLKILLLVTVVELSVTITYERLEKKLR